MEWAENFDSEIHVKKLKLTSSKQKKDKNHKSSLFRDTL